MIAGQRSVDGLEDSELIGAEPEEVVTDLEVAQELTDGWLGAPAPAARPGSGVHSYERKMSIRSIFTARRHRPTA